MISHKQLATMDTLKLEIRITDELVKTIVGTKFLINYKINILLYLFYLYLYFPTTIQIASEDNRVGIIKSLIIEITYWI